MHPAFILPFTSDIHTFPKCKSNIDKPFYAYGHLHAVCPTSPHAAICTRSVFCALPSTATICARYVPHLCTRPSARGLSPMCSTAAVCARSVPHLCTRPSARGPSHVLCTRSPNQLSYISACGPLHALSQSALLHLCTWPSARGPSHISCSARALHALSQISSPSPTVHHTHTHAAVSTSALQANSPVSRLSPISLASGHGSHPCTSTSCHDGTLPRLTPVLANALRRRGSLLIDSAQHTRQHYSYI